MSVFLEWNRHQPRSLDHPRLSPTDDGLPAQVVADAQAILAAVRKDGDAALVAYGERFDGVRLTPERLRVTAEEIRASAERADAELRAAIDHAIHNVRRFHEAQRPQGFDYTSDDGAALGWMWRAVGASALYVPGGRAAYPTSVIMNAVPALVAGVERIAVFTVPNTVEDNPAVAYALQALGLTEVWRVGGAQAIAAAAWGTESIAPVDVIVGPGNAWVAAAKREVFGRVGIDSVAGPSEVLILADASAPAEWVALDLVAQAEHDPLARSVVASCSREVLTRIATEVEAVIEASPRREIVEAAWRDHGALVWVPEPEDLVALTHRMAPEHLQVMLADEPDPATLTAGAIFMGAHTPTALGDYIVGPNHVLPTGGTARFSGPLNVHTFLRPTSLVRSSPAANTRLVPSGACIADQERLAAHAAALRARAEGSVSTVDDASESRVNDTLANLRPALRALAPYTLSATEAPVKLNQNESPWPPTAALRDEVLAAIAARPWNRYPDFHPRDILEGIGAHHGLSGEHVLIGNGSNELIQAFLIALVSPGQEVAHPEPTFALYSMMTRACGGRPVGVPLDEDLRYPVEAWRALAREGRAHLLVCSPNNPTGSVLSAEVIDELCSTTRRMVLVDEAYVPFGTFEVTPLLQRHPNLVVLRTFSKAAGLAGVRLGYALAHPSVAAQVHKVKLPYNVGLLGLEVARAALRHPEVFSGEAERIRDERTRLEEALRERPLRRVMTGAANFVLIQVDHPARLAADMLARGVLVRDVSRAPGLAGCLRLSVGSPEENAALLDALDACLQGERP